MGYLKITNINKRALGYMKSDEFESLIERNKSK
jgi:hypothetical protein